MTLVPLRAHAARLSLLLILLLLGEAGALASWGRSRGRRAPPPHRTTPSHEEQHEASEALDPPDTYRRWMLRSPKHPDIAIPQWLLDRPGVAGLSVAFGDAPIDPFAYDDTTMLLNRLGVRNFWDLERFMRASSPLAAPSTRSGMTTFYDLSDISHLSRERFWYEAHGFLQPDELIRSKLGWTPPDIESSGPKTQWLWDTNLSHIPEQQFRDGATPDDASFLAFRSVYNERSPKDGETEQRLQRSIFFPGEGESQAFSFLKRLVTELMADIYVERGKHSPEKVAEVLRREFELLDFRRSQFFLYSEQATHPFDLDGVRATMRLYDGSATYADPKLQALLGGERKLLPMQYSHEGLVIPERHAIELGCFTKDRTAVTPLPLFAEAAREILERHGKRDAEGNLTLELPDDFGVYVTALKGKQAEIYKKPPYGFRPATHLNYDAGVEEILWLPGQEAVLHFLSTQSSSLVPGKKLMHQKDRMRAERLQEALKVHHLKRTPEQHDLVNKAILGIRDDE